MVTKVVTALLATAMFAPAAWAQDAPVAEVSVVEQMQVDRPEPQHREGGWQARREMERPAEAPRPDAQARAPREPDQPRPTVRAEAQASAGWQGRDPGRRGDEQPPAARFDPPAMPQPQVRSEAAPRMGGDRNALWAARVERDQAEARRRDRPQGWDRNSGDPRWDRDRNPPRAVDDGRRPEARPAPFATDQRRSDDNRRFDDQRRWENERAGNDRNWNDNRRAAPPAAWNRGNDWNRRWHSDSRFDWGRYRQQNRDLFRLPRYYAPYAWHYGYRRFSVGVTLSSVLWGQDYWIDDPWFYRLPPAYGPYRWVRYYNDALLIDIRTGYVVDTAYDIFW